MLEHSFHSNAFPSEWGLHAQNDRRWIVIRFPFKCFPQRVGTTVIGMNQLEHYIECFHSNAFPSEWGLTADQLSTQLTDVVSIQMLSPASGDLARRSRQLTAASRFPFKCFPQRVGTTVTARHVKLIGSCFHSNAFPSEWGRQHDYPSTTASVGVSIQMLSPASGDAQCIDEHSASARSGFHSNAFPSEWGPPSPDPMSRIHLVAVSIQMRLRSRSAIPPPGHKSDETSLPVLA